MAAFSAFFFHASTVFECVEVERNEIHYRGGAAEGSRLVTRIMVIRGNGVEHGHIDACGGPLARHHQLSSGINDLRGVHVQAAANAGYRFPSINMSASKVSEAVTRFRFL